MKRKVVEIIWDDASSNSDRWQPTEASDPDDFFGMPCVTYGILLLETDAIYRVYMTRSTEGARAVEFDIPKSCVRRVRTVATVPNLRPWRRKVSKRQLATMMASTKGD